MVQLTHLNGKLAGTAVVAQRLPFVVGRESSADLCIDEPGIWGRHLELKLSVAEGVLLQSNPDALTLINGRPTANARLRNGDVIELGASQLRFSLGPTRQRGYRLREVLTWAAWVALAAAQFGLLYRLLP